MSFRYHRLDKNTNEKISEISALASKEREIKNFIKPIMLNNP